jgi:hypothetical protein
MADELKTIKFQMMLSEREARQIDDWSFANRLRSRAEAIRRLCQMALHVDPYFLDLMIALAGADYSGKSKEERDKTIRTALEAHAAWSLLRQGESMEDAEKLLTAVKASFFKPEHDQGE